MPKKTTQTLLTLIQRSLLLTQEKKEELLAMVSHLSGPQMERQIEVLKSEEGIMRQIVEYGISSVIENGCIRAVGRQAHSHNRRRCGEGE
jgi:hypothetical protein